jgi:hypothetical protein
MALQMAAQKVMTAHIEKHGDIKMNPKRAQTRAKFIG